MLIEVQCEHTQRTLTIESILLCGGGKLDSPKRRCGDEVAGSSIKEVFEHVSK